MLSFIRSDMVMALVKTHTHTKTNKQTNTHTLTLKKEMFKNFYLKHNIYV